MIQHLLTDKDLGEILGITTQAVTLRRLRGEGPPWMKLGPGKAAPVRYRPADVEEWLRESQVEADAERAAAK